MRRPLLLALVLLIGLGGATGCGKKGPLQPPPDSEAAKDKRER
jgi:predicted small lipoprotein YifL